MNRETRLARFVRPDLSERRLARQWSAVSDRLPQRGGGLLRFLPRAFVVLAMALGVVAISFHGRRAPEPTAMDGAILQTSPGQEQSLTLPDGSSIVLEGSTRLRLARIHSADVRLELQAGAVRLDVVHVEGRKVVVAAADVEVHVVGTLFRVGIEPSPGDRVSVSVDRGRVVVERPSTATLVATVSAGERWTSPVPPPTPSVTNPPSTPPSASASTPPLRPAAPSYRRLSAHFHEAFAEGDYAGAFADLESEDFARLVQELGPQDLLEVSIAARLTGRPRRAAMALDRLRTAFRKDTRAGLAALELGRLRLDELGDPEGALVALDDAVKLEPEGALREDAEARRVQALERLGDSTACVTARDLYLSRYPEGAHTVTVARRCVSP